jgi:hypothetical protein
MKKLILMALVLLASQVYAQDPSYPEGYEPGSSGSETFVPSPPPEPDLKAVTSDGRQVLLKSDHTWEIIEYKQGDPSTSAVLTVTKVWEMQDACKIQFRLQNNLGYLIGAIVPRFSVQNREGVMYESPSISFNTIKPTKREYTEIQISGLGCKDISQMKLIDASRCRMGQIDQWNEQPGECLSHIYLEPTQLLPLSK